MFTKFSWPGILFCLSNSHRRVHGQLFAVHAAVPVVVALVAADQVAAVLEVPGDEVVLRGGRVALLAVADVLAVDVLELVEPVAGALVVVVVEERLEVDELVHHVGRAQAVGRVLVHVGGRRVDGRVEVAVRFHVLEVRAREPLEVIAAIAHRDRQGVDVAVAHQADRPAERVGERRQATRGSP